MKKLGISLIIVLTLILAIPSISFADRFLDSFSTYIPNYDYYGYYDSSSPYYYRGYEYQYHESPSPYYYESVPSY